MFRPYSISTGSPPTSTFFRRARLFLHMTEDLAGHFHHVIALVCRCSARPPGLLRCTGAVDMAVDRTLGRDATHRSRDIGSGRSRHRDLRRGWGGKSRIAREALDSAAAQGHDIRWVVGTSCARGLPLGALASWAGLAGDDILHLVCGVIESLTAASSTATVVVGVDDVHLLDDLSTFVVHQIVQRRAAKVVLTVRDGEAIPLGIQELWKSDDFDRIDLQPLSPDETTHCCPPHWPDRWIRKPRAAFGS